MLAELVEQALKSGRRVRFRATGGSMRPSIREGDLLTVAPARAEELTIGDIVLSRAGEKLTAHRLVEIIGAGSPGGSPDGSGRFVCRGDAACNPDRPLAPSQVLGKVVAVEVCRGRRLLSILRRFSRGRVSGGCPSGR